MCLALTLNVRQLYEQMPGSHNFSECFNCKLVVEGAF